MIRLIATDLDGTLLEKGGALPEGFYGVAEDLKKLGILLVAASGRQYDNLRRKFQPIAREMGFVCENGGLNAVGREIVSIHPYGSRRCAGHYPDPARAWIEYSFKRRSLLLYAGQRPSLLRQHGLYPAQHHDHRGRFFPDRR